MQCKCKVNGKKDTLLLIIQLYALITNDAIINYWTLLNRHKKKQTHTHTQLKTHTWLMFDQRKKMATTMKSTTVVILLFLCCFLYECVALMPLRASKVDAHMSTIPKKRVSVRVLSHIW
jgi:hypothetical protein